MIQKRSRATLIPSTSLLRMLVIALLMACGGAPSRADAPGAKRALQAGSSGSSPPIVLNASAEAGPGDVVSLQGENFGEAPRVFLEDSASSPLEIVNRVGTGWLAVHIPTTARGALMLRVSNGGGTSARVALNAARPLHLDTLMLAPGGRFRLFGRNLMVAGATPRLTVGGQPASIDKAHSDAYMLTATAPIGLHAAQAVDVIVDNGNGSGPARLDRRIGVDVDGAGDPFSLGVGWGAAFAPIHDASIDAAADPRLPSRAVCNGQQDDTPAIQAAIELAATSNGGVVKLGAGKCRLAGGLTLRSRVVLQGAGKDATELVYEANYPVAGSKIDLAGIRDLTLTNSGKSSEGPLLKDSARVFIQNVRVRLATSRQMFLTGNKLFVIARSEFEQTGSIAEQGPYLLNDSAGLVFEGNTTRWVGGAPAFWRVHDSFVHGNRFTRDGRKQDAGGTVHSMTMDFAYRLAVVGNTFDVSDGPISNKKRNDGEALLTEGGGNQRTENLGIVAGAGPDTLSDPGNTIRVDPFGTGSIPENYGVAIVAGKGAGQTRRLVAYRKPTMTVDRPWDVVPDGSSHYATFVWGLEKSLIQGNRLAGNPRGIWLYHTAVQDIAVIDNMISDGGGIYLRSYQNLGTRSFMPQYNVLIAGNQVGNSTGLWMSYIDSVFVDADDSLFGTATIGIEMRSNRIIANRPNISSATEEYAGVEGYMNMMRVENDRHFEAPAFPALQGAILTRNTCVNCDVGIRVGTGAGGTTIFNVGGAEPPLTTADWATTPGGPKATDTVIR